MQLMICRLPKVQQVDGEEAGGLEGEKEKGVENGGQTLESAPLHEYEQLWLATDDGRYAFFADMSVYSRNRCFRLLSSRKFTKIAHLQPTNRFLGAKLYGYDLFVASLAIATGKDVFKKAPNWNSQWMCWRHGLYGRRQGGGLPVQAVKGWGYGAGR